MQYTVLVVLVVALCVMGHRSNLRERRSIRRTKVAPVLIPKRDAAEARDLTGFVPAIIRQENGKLDCAVDCKTDHQGPTEFTVRCKTECPESQPGMPMFKKEASTPGRFIPEYNAGNSYDDAPFNSDGEVMTTEEEEVKATIDEVVESVTAPIEESIKDIQEMVEN